MAQTAEDVEITIVDSAARLSGAEPPQLLDVREDHERQAGYVAPSAHIPMAELPARAGELDPATPVIVYCRSGVRSLMAAQALRSVGFEAYSMAGGIVDWAAAGYGLEPSGGIVADIEREAQ